MIDQILLGKYNKAVPRYTSYPTVPNWHTDVNSSRWLNVLKHSFKEFNKETGISIYIHLPFCESLCTYCGCNKRITKNHKLEKPYIDNLLKEWGLYRDVFEEDPLIKEIHLGGGTPTFFSPDNLAFLINEIKKGANVSEDACFSFEAHPANTTEEHLDKLHEIGFTRVSYGIQDFDPKVQKAINRYQSFEQVEETVKQARSIGYTSINFDLIYGLPFQTTGGLLDTLNKTILLNPERIAYYSYAHVPWTAKGQRAYNDEDLPSPDQKLLLYHIGKKFLVKHGYKEIGMDHYVKDTDSMYKAQLNGELHRNFMGYTTTTSKILVGLGVSAISDAHFAYSQNVKTLEEYESKLSNNEFPLIKQHYLSNSEVDTRITINSLMCKFKADLPVDWFTKLSQGGKDLLQEMSEEGLVKIEPRFIEVEPKGREYIRNICTVFDKSYWGNYTKSQLFSKSI